MTIPTTDQEKIDLIIDYLCDHPDQLSFKKREKPDISTPDGKSIIQKEIQRAIHDIVEPKTPTTVPDPVVRIILEEFYLIPKEDLAKVEKEHQYSMAAENFIGKLLEEYIATVSDNNSCGWTRAYGDVIRAIDFIKKDGDQWVVLQVKNRSNSENSSSSSVRKGTNIMKWYRTIASSGNTRWNKFPDHCLKAHLSEASFRSFVSSYLQQINKGETK